MADITKPARERPFLDRYFGLSESGSDVRTEFIAAVTTFLTMVYIVFVNPQILGNAGMDKGAVFVAICIAAAASTLVMALYANYPIALAPGMGLNAFFAFTVVLEHKYSWQQALAAVFCSGVIFFLISIFKIREYIINSIPKNLKLAISAGVGLFLGIIALEEAKIVVANPATLVTLGDLRQWPAILCLAGFIVIVALNYRNILGATLIGILVVALVGVPLGLAEFKGIVLPPPSLAPTFLQLDFSRFGELTFIIIVFSFLMVDVFDNAGTLMRCSSRRPPRCRRQPAAHEAGAARGQFCGDVWCPHRHIDHDELYRERGRRFGRRPHRPDRRFRGVVLFAGSVLLPACGNDSRLCVGGGVALRRLRDDARTCRDRLGGHHGICPGRGGCGDHAAHLFDRNRHRSRVHHLCLGEADRRQVQ